MNVPNFFILGAARCGTTSLYRSLQQHPDVFMSSPKEPKFFEAEWDRGAEHYWATYFAGWAGEEQVGEARPANLFLPYVAERIRALAPHARLIVILRDPVHRAYSSWRLRRLNRLEPASFAEAIEENLASLSAGRTFAGEAGERLWRERERRFDRPDGLRVYVDLGHYAEQLSRYLALFPRSRIEVLWHDDLCRDAPRLVRRVWRFLGVDPDRGRADTTRHNASLDPSLRPFVRLARSARLDALLSPQWKGRLRSIAARALPQAPVDAAAQERLRQHYEPHVRALEALVGRDLSHWL